ncbi:hypothetical protein GN244_ATG04834 [Phytophthora infestans]|uniref:Secreted RxLR effector peptide protein n=1 Tax=Phytophthora infestans TaxID=4787 RepID=Q8H6Z5_PHYIN|nr:unknown [Phytophthora infestans]KAF4042915.1 hypothetical protein GN244_ATG04834 [Phytophthora infestans]
MGVRTLGVLLATLCVVLSTLVSANDMATNSSASASIASSGSGSETIAQLLVEVQAAVADDPALANMFDISSASQMREEELTTLLQDILALSLSGSSSANSLSSSSGSTTAASAEATQSDSAAGSTVSGATSVTLPTSFAVLATVVTLVATL